MKTSPAFEHCGLAIDATHETGLLELPVEEIKRLFKEHGVLYFRGFDASVKDFEHFSNQFTSDFMDHRGGGSLREVINKDGDQTILSVSYSFTRKNADFDNEAQRTFPLALHSDRSYTTSQPPVMFFYCACPAAKEGETTVVDGIRLYQSLRPSTREFFARQQINYVRNYRDGEWQLWARCDSLDEVQAYCDTNELKLTIRPDQSITTESLKWACVHPRWKPEALSFVNSILLVQWQEDAMNSKRSVVRMADGRPIPRDILDELNETGERLTGGVRWSAGELVMLDNTRMLHGRRSFADPRRSIYTRMARSVPW